MLLAEALIYRKELKQRLDFLTQRLAQVAVKKDGQQPLEEPVTLLAEFDEALSQYRQLITAIHKTNLVAKVDGDKSVTEAVIIRDMLDERMALLRKIDTVVSEKAGVGRNLFNDGGTATVAAVDIAVIRMEITELAKQRRNIDAQIQRANWNAELVEPVNLKA